MRHFLGKNAFLDVFSSKFCYNSTMLAGIKVIKCKHRSHGMKYGVICAIICYSVVTIFKQKLRSLQIFFRSVQAIFRVILLHIKTFRQFLHLLSPHFDKTEIPLNIADILHNFAIQASIPHHIPNRVRQRLQISFFALD